MPNNGGEDWLHGHAVLEHRLELRSVGSACAVGISEGFCYGHPSQVHLSSTLLVWVATLYCIIAPLTDLHFQ
jgi:hypothetical protein